MRILAIRGRNLASLCGEFEVDLAAEPLASAGLFAITGPTGAGKSTLLDALCLALFDRTPRLDGRGGAKVGRADQEDSQRVHARDVRGLLARGRGSGFAEVDFASRGQRWRARWAVRRARERAEGRLQQQTLVLEDLDTGEQIGGTKTEVLQAIRDRVGLSFDQFRRSALLAQGDFAAFLHAAPKARAELLERVTGTAIYARLSEASFVRAKAEREVLEGLAIERSNLGLLEPEARQQLEQAASAAMAAVAAAKQALDQADTTVRWFAERTTLRVLEAAGVADHAEASKAWEGARERREIWGSVKAAQPLRSWLDQLDAATARRDEARKRLARDDDRLADAGEAKAKAEKRLATARAGWEHARQEIDRQAPALTQAASLDERLVAAQRDAEEAVEGAARASSRAREEGEASAAVASSVDDAKQQRTDAAAWLRDHPEAQTLSGAWDHLDAAFREHARALGAVTAHGEDLPSSERAAAQAAAAAQLATTQAQVTERELETCQRAVAAAEAAIPEGQQEQLEARRRNHERRREAIRAAEETLAAAQRIQAEQQRAEAAAEDARKRQQAASRAVEETGDALRDHAIRADEAERSLRASQAVRDLDGRRAELVDGEPCPLCGARAHPARHEGVSVDTLAGQRQRVRELKDRGLRLTAARATASEKVKSSGSEAELQWAQAADSVDQLTVRLGSWARVLDTAGELGFGIALPESPLATGAAAAVAGAQAETRQVSDDLLQRERELRSCEQQAKDARSIRDAAHQECDQRAAARERAKEDARAAADALVNCQRQQNEERQRLAAARQSLGTSLAGHAGWRQQLDADGDAFRAACRDEAHAFDQHTAAREGAMAMLAALEPRAATVAAQAAAARDTAAKEEDRRRQLVASRETLRAQREGLLGGQSVADAKRTLDQASAKADQARDAASEAEREARAGWNAAEARLEAARSALRQESSGLEDAQQALHAALAEHEVDLASLRQRLERAPAWCDREGRALDEIRQRVQMAASVLAERRQRREDHEGTDRPTTPEAEAPANQTIAAEEHQKAESTAREWQVELKQDDAARARGDALATKIAQQEAQSARWAMLNDAIGSHDGSRFRKFAQGLTLDSLLGYANAHLRDLAPRYHLNRVPGEDLELQVIDRDMGDEVRAINSLSGGETFLASLALALGLSSLSASDTPVESLFIDEGFGTLDLKTLDIALSALDALQASGRQVGVISHVQDLGQRIGAQVRVLPLGAGRSRVETTAGF